MTQNNFIEDVKQLREKARETINQGAITASYSADIETILRLLNTALATELICVLRYKNHYYQAKNLGAKVAADEFLEHAQQEQEHADSLSNRITQLGAIPNLDPKFMLEHSHAEYVECGTVGEMIKENLVAERIAIDSYRQMIKYIGDNDPTTRNMLEAILATEEEHADDLMELKAEYNIDF